MNRSRTWRALLLAALAGVGGCMSDMDSFVQGGGGIGGAGGTMTAGGSGGAGGTCDAQCCEPTDCPAPDQVCVARTCVQGACGETVVLEGQDSPWQTAGDCRKYICNADGDSDWTHDELDPLNDGIQCTVDVCVYGTPANTPVDANTPCNQNGGKYCNTTGECVECSDDMHCPGQVCSTANQCVPPACKNGMKDTNETDVDCGGPCMATCETGESCNIPGDCIDGICEGGTCAAPTCQDGIKNGFETDVDCGPNCDEKCQPMQHCQNGTDCLGGQCSGSVCVPNCQDGVKNNAETGVDCGGPNCGECAVGEECQVGGDCLDGHCIDGVCCDAACTGECLACSSAKTGAPDGACAPVAAGTDPDNECDPEPGLACGNTTGLCGGNGHCEKQPDGTVCGPVGADSCAGGVQTTADACDGLGTCVASTTTPCSPYVCDATACRTSCAGDADCEGTSYCAGSQCVPKKPNGDACSAANECGSGSCVDGVCCNTACGGGAAGDCQACDVAGSVGTCVPLAGGTVCRGATGVCDTQEVCNGSSVDCPADGVVAAGTVCRAAAGVCDAAETCNGVAKTCPADGFAPTSTMCRAATDLCDTPEYCTGSGPFCPGDLVQPSGSVCRPSGGPCDVPETCNGTTKTCPSNSYAPPTTLCRAATDVCDSSEYCTGSNAFCPNDGVMPPGTTCRASAGPCDVAEVCNGSTKACPGNGYAPPSTLCRAATDVCDQPEYCTGNAVSCPNDAVKSPGTMCRASSGVCDVQESCNGSSKACPADLYRPAGYACSQASCSGTLYSPADVCNGSGTCTDSGTNSCDVCLLPYGCVQCQPGSIQLCSCGADCVGEQTCSASGSWGACAEQGVLEVVAGGNHTCARLNDGRVKCWGSNTYGQLGLGDTTNRGDNPGEMGASLPAVQLGTGKTAIALALGAEHTCALLNDNTVKCWGRNQYGQLGQGNTASRGDNSGEMGDALPTVQLGTGKFAVAIGVGDNQSCAVLNDGSVKCWGANTYGQLAVFDTSHRGDNPGEMGDALPAFSAAGGFVSVDGGANHTCARANDTRTYCWGHNASGQLGVCDTVNRGSAAGQAILSVNFGMNTSDVAVGGNQTFTKTDTGSVRGWGYNAFGQLGIGNTNNWGDWLSECSSTAVNQIGLSLGGVMTSLSAGGSHACASADNGTTKCWGLNGSGQLGLGDSLSRGSDSQQMSINLPAVQLGLALYAVAVTAGGTHTCALLNNGSVKCWGLASSGQLGLGDTISRGDHQGEMGDNLPAVKLFSNVW